MTEGFLSIPWPVWGLVTLAVAAVFAVFVPRAEKVRAMTGAKYIIVRWFHSLVWVLLSASFFMRAVDNQTVNGLADPVAALGGLTYLVYVGVALSALAA